MQLLSHSWMTHTPPGRRGGGQIQSSRSLHTVALLADGIECSAQPRADRWGRQTVAAWGW